MNILVVAQYQNDGSPTAIFVHAQMLAYQKLGHSIRAIVPIAIGKRDLNGHRWEPGLYQEDIDGIPHYFIRHLSLSNYGKKHINSAAALYVLRSNLSHILNGFAPDIIHAHTLGLSSDLGSWLKERLGVPLVTTTHGSDTAVPLEQGKGAELCSACDRADAVVAVSSALAEKVRSCGTRTHVPVILNGYDFCALPPRNRVRGCTFIQVGHLQEQKRVHVTISAFAQLRKKYPYAVLNIIGSGSELHRLHALCEELGIADAVHFQGALPNAEVLAAMAKSLFFIMPSIREGFGIVYLEAMASGCITIGTEGEGIADLIVSGENGFLVPPDDPGAIAQVVEWCLSHPDEAAAIAERGQQDAIGLTWEKNAAQYLILFKELIL